MGMNTLSTHDKALRINIDAARYGTFAEIGAGQEVARWFFHVGGRGRHRRQDDSAYDMAVSDAVYGPAKRYVSRQRLQSMLDHEWSLLLERLDGTRGATTKFFVFADTVTARSYSRQEEGQGWLGIRFQAEPRGAAVGDHHPRAHVGPGERAPAGGAGHAGRQPDPRRLLRPRAAGGPHRVPHGRADPGPDGSGHDPVLRPGLRRRGQPAHEPAARPAAPDQRRPVRAGRRGGGARGAAPPRAGADRARKLPPDHAGHPRHAGALPAAHAAGAGHAGPGAGGAHGDDPAQPLRWASRWSTPISWPGWTRCAPWAGR